MSDFFSALSTGIANLGLNQFSSALSSKRQWKYTKKAMALQDKYNRAFTKDSYGLMREGLESADYNPLLAVGGSANTAMPSATLSATDSDAGDQAINSALAFQANKAQIRQANSNSALAVEQAETEKSKRTQMDFQNAMYDVQKHLYDKDLDWYERKSYMQLYNQFQQAESYKAQSAIGAMNAETAKQDMLNRYSLGKYHNETERNTYDTGVFGIHSRGYSPPQKRNYKVRTDSRSEYGYWN